MTQKMHRILPLAAALAVSGLAVSGAAAQTFEQETLVTREQAFGGPLPADGFPIVGGFGVLDGQLYATISQNNSGNGRITTGAPGTTFTVVAGEDDFINAGIDPEGFTLNSQLPVIGNFFQFADTLNDQVASFSPTSGLNLVNSNAQVEGFTGTNASLTGAQASFGNGILFYDTGSDSILQSSPSASGSGMLSTYLSSSELTDAIGTDDVDGLDIVGNTLVFGSGGGNGVFAGPVFGDGDITQVLDAGDFESIFGDGDASIDFRALAVGNDGLVYLYESDSDAIFRFDLTMPEDSLELVLTDQQLSDGPAGTDIISG